jgi:hypothetical protein
MKREERKQLDALSKLLTGKSSAWKKSMEQGYKAPMEEKLEDGTIRKYVGLKYPTLTEVREEMDKALKDKVLKEKLEAEKKAKVEEESKQKEDQCRNE